VERSGPGPSETPVDIAGDVAAGPKDHVDLDILNADRYKVIFSSCIEWIPKHEG
jgi:hypothetical protein